MYKRQIYQVTTPFNLRILSLTVPVTEVQCSDDVTTQYQLFLDNFGFTDSDFEVGCTPIESDINNPDFIVPPSVIDFSCGSPQNPGNGSLRVQFWLIDGCGHSISTIAEFRVVDDLAPVIAPCPDSFSIDIGVVGLIDSIEMHLNQAVAILSLIHI